MLETAVYHLAGRLPDRRLLVATMMYPVCLHLAVETTDREAARRAVEMADLLLAELDRPKEKVSGGNLGNQNGL